MIRSSVPPAPLAQENFESDLDLCIEEFILAHIFYQGNGDLQMRINLKNGSVLRAFREYRSSEFINNDCLTHSSEEDIDFVKANIKRSIKDIKSGKEFIEYGVCDTDHLTLHVKIEKPHTINNPHDPTFTRRKYTNILKKQK